MAPPTPDSVITATPVEPTMDRRNAEVFQRTLFSRDDQIFHVLDAGTLQFVTTVLTGGHPRAVAFSQDGSIAVSANEEGWVDFLP